jgi:hypothetical protein
MLSEHNYIPHPLNFDSEFDKSEEEYCQQLTPRIMSAYGIDLDSGGCSRNGCAEAMNANGWESSSSDSVSSPSQHTFFDWLRERRISDESDWQPDLADLLTTLAGEDFRVFALEDKNSSLCRTESSKSSSPTRAGSSGAISEMRNRYFLCFYTLVLPSLIKSRASSNQWSQIWIPNNQLDFFHGKSLLKSLDFDAMSYSHDTLSQLVIEIFIEVCHTGISFDSRHKSN